MADQETRLAPIDQANLLAGQAVAAATAFLEGRHAWKTLLNEAAGLQLQLAAINDVGSRDFVDPVRLLVRSLRGLALTARAYEARESGLDQSRLERWEQVTASLVELVRTESQALLQRTGVSA
jgi:predicted membrane chloride channel (bestrophin family)